MRSHRRQLDQRLWTVDYPDHRAGGLRLGARTTLIETEQGLWVHSPGPPGPHLSDLAAPFALIAPNSLHYLYIAETSRSFPLAQVFAPPELLAKVPLQAQLLTSSPSADIEYLPLDGLGSLGEWVFLHRPSRTLIVTDLVFHLKDSPDFWTRLIMRCNGVYGRLGPSRIFRTLFVKSRQDLKSSIGRVLDWDFDRLVLAHGEILETGAKDALRKAFCWLGPL
ncbi:hypothetical protein JST97_18280 [bacterium]|nr:hypothetical protein [bacterium]